MQKAYMYVPCAHSHQAVLLFFSRAKEDESNPEQTSNPVILHVRDPAKLNSGTE